MPSLSNVMAKKRKCPHCFKLMVAFKNLRKNFPHGRKSYPVRIFKRVKFVCFNPECPHRAGKRKKYVEFSLWKRDWYPR